MSNRRDNQFLWNPHNKATLLDCSFIVDSANGNGFGIRSLKNSGRIANVFMHTSVTPGVGLSGITNPNPIAGYIQVQLQDNYNRYLTGFSGFASPVSGTPLTSTTANHVYVITSLGSTTAAQWLAAGVPAYVVPAVGVSFVAAQTGSIGGTGAVEVIATAGSGIDHIEVVGDPNLMNSSGALVIGAGVGMSFNLACFSGGALTAPADGTVIGLAFYMNNSAQGV